MGKPKVSVGVDWAGQRGQYWTGNSKCSAPPADCSVSEPTWQLPAALPPLRPLLARLGKARRGRVAVPTRFAASLLLLLRNVLCVRRLRVRQQGGQRRCGSPSSLRTLVLWLEQAVESGWHC